MQSRINQAYRRLKEYMSSTPLWARANTGVLGSKPVAYFSLEFGIHESVPIYSGGLGVLSGDHIKSASGLGVPLVAVGLFYGQGYFKQRLDDDGYQREEYVDTKVENLPMEPARCPDGKGTSHVDDSVTDARDSADLTRVLQEQVIPMYYERDVDGLPQKWIKRMMNSISTLAWRFSAHRMVADYVHHAYIPSAGGRSCDMSRR